jgi:hypothetical protein
MKRVYIDENGNIDDVSPQGMKAWLEKYDQMKNNGASEAQAKAAANAVQEKMDDVCFNGILLDNGRKRR